MADDVNVREWAIGVFVLAEVVEDEDIPARLGDCGEDLSVGSLSGPDDPFGALYFQRPSDDPERALRDVIGALTGAYGEDAVLGVDPELIDVSGVAGDLGVTREAVRHWADGRRGPGRFPQPVGTVGKGQRVWRWYDVLEWVRRNGLGDSEGDHPIPTHILLKVDAEIQARRAAKAETAAA